MTTRVHIGDITQLRVDAIVNAANDELLPGGGVCGAIHRAAGPQMAVRCRELAPCETGKAVITPGYDLQAKYVIHAVGPRYRDGARGEPELLASCYRESLILAVGVGCQSIAFPCISTGIYGYPPEDAARIAELTVRTNRSRPKEVIFCCFSAEGADRYSRILEKAAQ
jgi:O-acetyl-ADP-ribose deacetylase (regulator of RNase III)